MAINSELEMVNVAVPSGDFGGLKGKLMGVEEEAESLDPCEISGATNGSMSSKPSIDLNIRVRYKAEVFIALSVEIEHNTITTNKPRV